jgi:hypothetical protein
MPVTSRGDPGRGDGIQRRAAVIFPGGDDGCPTQVKSGRIRQAALGLTLLTPDWPKNNAAAASIASFSAAGEMIVLNGGGVQAPSATGQ